MSFLWAHLSPAAHRNIPRMWSGTCWGVTPDTSLGIDGVLGNGAGNTNPQVGTE
jgi:hypothetical protein